MEQTVHWADQLIADAEAGPETYAAKLETREGYTVTNCPHAHKSREAAERCADGWLRKALQRDGIDPFAVPDR